MLLLENSQSYRRYSELLQEANIFSNVLAQNLFSFLFVGEITAWNLFSYGYKPYGDSN